MAQRRMFSAQIVSSDAFLEMPISSQGLYFHLGMSADDDGFVTPRKVLRMLGVGEDDLKILIAKKFVIPFESGVIVITHWKQNNYLRNDRYTPSIYTSEKGQLSSIQGVYVLDTIGIPNGYHLDTQEGRKEGRKEEEIFSQNNRNTNNREKNEDLVSPARRAQIFEKGRQILAGKRKIDR